LNNIAPSAASRAPLFLLWHWCSAPVRYRHLLHGFLHQDITGRFVGSMGGLLWSVITPLANILIYIFVFSVIMRITITKEESGTDQFVIYLLSGLLPWMAFSEAISRSTPMLIEKAGLITKVAFPVHILPYVGVFSAFMLNGLGLGLFLLYLVVNGYADWHWFYLPLLVILHGLFTLGMAALTAALCVFLRDLQQLMTLLITVWFFITPIIYPISMVPPEFRAWIEWNPLYYVADLYRQILLQGSCDFTQLGITALICISVYLSGGWFFMRVRHAFGDVL
jgi:lipopolysaccharide transport system permease protein